MAFSEDVEENKSALYEERLLLVIIMLCVIRKWLNQRKWLVIESFCFCHKE